MDPEASADEVSENKELLSEVIKGVSSHKEAIRYQNFKILAILTEKTPEIVYPYWDYFVDLLGSDNSYLKYIGIQIIADLTKADTRNRFENIFDKYYNLLDDRSMIAARYVAGNSAKIVMAKPNLQLRITNRLLSIDETHHHPERKDLIKGDAIESFSAYFERVEDKQKVLEFVKNQLNARSPRTRKKAKEFLKRWG